MTAFAFLKSCGQALKYCCCCCCCFIYIFNPGR